MKTTLPRRTNIIALIALSMTVCGVARATEEFPSVIYRHLNADYSVSPYEPPCMVCHLRGSTGTGTAETPFARSMKARGLQPEDNASLTTALDAMQRDRVDSDGDGVTDVQEIERDTDPNTPANVSLSGAPGPNAGCGGGERANHGNSGASAVGIGVLSLGLLRFRRRFRKHQR